MKTLLSHFCTEFQEKVRPVLAPLERLSARLDALPAGSELRALAPRVRSIAHQLDILSDKIAEQQAYVLIFGPLKSGKSTLMNAIAGAYVSEVTTLPAYPCMVYVGHAAKPEYKVTAYDGRAHSFPDAQALRDLLERAHGELANRIRTVEARGEDFDPAVHLPGAARRIDVRTPAPALGDSGALLVDTPGLYSRMRFGYDQMTREFRNAAASAIFVVKTDNLFLEQVFDEFSDLLRLFSRIFLVVNLDGTKQDLEPDGTLRPSLEGRDPQQIIEAFERLAMSAELETARTEGRLGIYPMDLLRAASRRLRRVEPKPDADEPSADVFDRFLADLTEYLNGTNYLVSFLGDALRQSRSLLDDLDALGKESPLGALDTRIAALEAARDRSAAMCAAVQRLEDYAWEETFGRLRDEVMRLSRERSVPLRAQTVEQVESVLASWFETDASFASLVRDEFRPALISCRDGVQGLVREVSRAVIGSDVGGAMVRREVSEDVGRLDLSLAEICRSALENATSPSAGKTPALEISARVVPVKKSIVDWLLFRSRARVRQSLLGPDDAPTRTIPQRVKQKRLGPARVALAEALRARLELFFVETIARVGGETFGAHVAAVCTEIRARLATSRAEHGERLLANEARLAELVDVREAWRTLERTAAVASDVVVKLRGEVARPAPEEADATAVVPEVVAPSPPLQAKAPSPS
jgi:energy-coupling factor transporter ATP-binding protein EcfA2